MTNPYIEDETHYGATNYAPLPIVLVKGEGVYIWDDNDNRYIDMMGAYSAVSFGHTHPELLSVLKEQANRLCIVSRAFYTDQLGPFLKKACEVTGFEKALPMNTGAEAVETAIKAVRKWAYQIKEIEKDKAEIIVCDGNFHGRTTTIISMSSEKKYQEGFSPLTPGFKLIPFGDAKKLEQAITKNTAAFLVEPIQGENGIVVPPVGYLKACEKICKKHNVLLICDEIQTGLGRTGQLLASNHEGVKPDAIVLGKALGGGFLPVSLFLARKEIMDVFRPGDHGSTFGGNPLAAAIGLRAISLLFEENLIEHAATLGDYFKTRLKAIQSPLIKEVRGQGLLIGVEIDSAYSAYDICLKLLSHGILTKETHEHVIRLAPPLTITEKEIDQCVSAIKIILNAFSQSDPLP